MKIDDETIASYARQLQGLSVSPKRADELAVELTDLVSGVLNAAENSSFEDEPSHFFLELSRLSRARRNL
jgi:hypothetical protein